MGPANAILFLRKSGAASAAPTIEDAYDPIHSHSLFIGSESWPTLIHIEWRTAELYFQCTCSTNELKEDRKDLNVCWQMTSSWQSIAVTYWREFGELITVDDTKDNNTLMSFNLTPPSSPSHLRAIYAAILTTVCMVIIGLLHGRNPFPTDHFSLFCQIPLLPLSLPQLLS